MKRNKDEQLKMKKLIINYWREQMWMKKLVMNELFYTTEDAIDCAIN